MATAVLGAKLLSMVMLRTSGLEVTPPTVWRTLTATLPAPKVAMSAEVKEVADQAVPLTVAVLLTLAPVLVLVNCTATLAPDVHVPLVVAVAALTSLKLTMSLPAILAAKVGVATV